MIGWTVKRDQQVGLARDPQQVAAARARACPDDGVATARSSPSRPPRAVARLSSAARPVSAMNTSSSVGRPTAMSSIADAGLVERAAPPRRSRPRRLRIGTRTMPSVARSAVVGDIGASAAIAALGLGSGPPA